MYVFCEPVQLLGVTFQILQFPITVTTFEISVITNIEALLGGGGLVPLSLKFRGQLSLIPKITEHSPCIQFSIHRGYTTDSNNVPGIHIEGDARLPFMFIPFLSCEKMLL